jgi:hypothetical protein
MRKHLPERRLTHTQTFQRDGITFTMSVGYYRDNSVGELFINADRGDHPELGTSARGAPSNHCARTEARSARRCLIADRRGRRSHHGAGGYRMKIDSLDPVTIVLVGAPVARWRPRVSAWKGRVRVQTPEATRVYEEAFRLTAFGEMRGRNPFAAPVEVLARFVFAPPASWSEKNGWQRSREIYRTPSSRTSTTCKNQFWTRLTASCSPTMRWWSRSSQRSDMAKLA